MNYCINPKQESEWLPTWRPSAHKFSQQIYNKLKAEVESECMYPAPNNQNVVVMFSVAKWDPPDKPRFVTDYRLKNQNIYKKQTL